MTIAAMRPRLARKASSIGVLPPRSADEIDEDVFQRRFVARQVCGPARIGATAASNRAGSRPLTCSALPKGATLSMPGVCFSRRARSSRSGPVTV